MGFYATEPESERRGKVSPPSENRVWGFSVTTTLPLGTPSDVRRQMDWLVEKGPKTGLMLGGSSSIAPGVPIENIKTLIEGFRHYRENGRSV